ncbi:hypothetical protein [Actinoplanes subtropicus]|uniref:hypothetical protein n=1 Tax=Actinoplanes subtropicus TaxID=543632 RepID=UPI0004C315BB|nr:hypothetical protein [Actinoplanes subtropicus]
MEEINSVVAPPGARPPREWELQTFALMVAAGVAALLGMLLLASDVAVRSYLANDGVDGLSPLVGWVLDNGDVISALYLVLGFGYVFGFIYWRRRTVAMLTTVGDSDPHVVWHWSVTGWYGALMLSTWLLFTRTVDSSHLYDRDDLMNWLGWDIARLAIRLVGLTCLLIAVWQIREQVRERVATSGVILRFRDMPPRPSAIPLPPAARPAPVEAPAADDDFWGNVAALATGRRAEIAVLETTDGLARRWLLVPESGDLGAVRSAVAPGAVVSAFPEPPDASETKDFTPRPADEYHGFLEDADSGAVWYQSVKPNRVGAFLARARRARRWALYPADSPEALTAVLPPSR